MQRTQCDCGLLEHNCQQFFQRSRWNERAKLWRHSAKYSVLCPCCSTHGSIGIQWAQSPPERCLPSFREGGHQVQWGSFYKYFPRAMLSEWIRALSPMVCWDLGQHWDPVLNTRKGKSPSLHVSGNNRSRETFTASCSELIDGEGANTWEKPCNANILQLLFFSLYSWKHFQWAF